MRAYLEHPYLNVKRGTLVATNSVIMCELPVEVEEGDVEGWIPVELLKTARKSYDPESIRLEPETASLNGTSMRRPNTDAKQPFPDPAHLFPAERELSQQTISVNVAELYRLSKALGESCVTLRFQRDRNASNDLIDPRRPVLVEPHRVPGDRRGILMPIAPLR